MTFTGSRAMRAAAVGCILLFIVGSYMWAFSWTYSSGKSSEGERTLRLASRSLESGEGPGHAHASHGNPLWHARNMLLDTQVKMHLQKEPAIGILFAKEVGITEAELWFPTSKLNVWDLYPPEASCPLLERIGSVGDGGKWICDIGLLSSSSSSSTASTTRTSASASASANNAHSNPTAAEATLPPCVVFSYGVETDSSFEEALITGTRCSVFAFDPTVGGINSRKGYDNSNFVDSRGKPREGASASVVHPIPDRQIRFEKIALADSSGGSTLPIAGSKKSIDIVSASASNQPKRTHLLSETLSDAMRRHGVAFIDLLKVDIEGEEWDTLIPVLEKCAGTSTSPGTSPPFGQLLVELHYKDLSRLQKLFNLLRQCGFLSVNREVNVQPCVNVGFCTAAEYTFIHPSAYYGRAADTASASASISTSVTSAVAVPVPLSIASQQWLQIPSGVIYILSQKSRLDRLACALQLLYINMWAEYPHYPVVVFHDDLDQESQRFLFSALERVRGKNGPKMDLRLHLITLEFPPSMTSQDKEDPSILEGPQQCPASLGYRHMCNFHAFRAVDLLTKLGYHQDYIMRLDDDSHISSSVSYDPIALMQANKKMYGFVKVMNDDPLCVRGLWTLARTFLDDSLKTGLLTPERHAAAFNTSSQDSLFSLFPAPSIFYNNFEIVHRSVWQGPLMDAWRDTVVKSKGVYLYRWGDAPIHTIAAAIVLRKSDLHAFKDFPYRHLPFIDQISGPLPHPQEDPFNLKSGCYYYDHWVCSNGTDVASLKGLLPQPSFMVDVDVNLSGYGDNNMFLTKSLAQGNEQAQEQEQEQEQEQKKEVILRENESVVARLQRLSSTLSVDEISSAMHATQVKVVLPGNLHPSKLLSYSGLSQGDGGSSVIEYASDVNTVASSLSNPARGVLYTFVFHEFEVPLARSIFSFYNNFAMSYKVPFVVFYTDTGGYLPQQTLDHLKLLILKAKDKVHVNGQMPNIKFVSVPVDPLAKLGKEAIAGSGTCVAGDTEGRAASLYLRENAPQALSDLGYHYFWRFGMDSVLTTPVKRDVFWSMRTRGQVFGFKGVIKENPLCLSGAWELARSICSGSYGQTIESVAAMKAEREASVLVIKNQLTNDPNVHCSEIFDEWEPGAIFFTSFEVTSKALFDAVIVKKLLSGIQQHEQGNKSLVWGDALVHTLAVIMALSKEAIINLKDIPYRASGSFGYDRDYDAEIETKGKLGTNDDAGTKDALIMTAMRAPPSLPVIDTFFEPQRFGWLGGDVAASFWLPPIAAAYSPAGAEHVSESGGKYIWLFGDTLIGTSNAVRRLEATMVSNSIGVSTLTSATAAATTVRSVIDTKKRRVDTDTENSKKKEVEEDLDDKETPLLHNMESMHYYWQSGSTGAPAAVLTVDAAHFHIPDLPSPVPFASKVVAAASEGVAAPAVREVPGTVEAAATLIAQGPQFWPTGGVSFVASHGIGNGASIKTVIIGKMVVPAMQKRSVLLEEAETGLAFQDVGSAIFVVDNPHSPPNQWVYTCSFMAFEVMGTGSASRTVNDHDRQLWTTLAATSLQPKWIYIAGFVISGTGGGRRSTFDLFAVEREKHEHAIIARISPSALLAHNTASMEILQALVSKITDQKFGLSPSTIGGGVGDATVWKSVATGGNIHPYRVASSAAESSLHFDATRKRWILVSLAPLGHLQVCETSKEAMDGGGEFFASYSTFPFSCRSHKVPKRWQSDKYITYAAKAHPEFSATADTDITRGRGKSNDPEKRGKLVVSLIANPVDGPVELLLAENRQAYTPRFFLV